MKMLTEDELRELLIEAWKDGLDQGILVAESIALYGSREKELHSEDSFNRCCEFVNNQLQKV